MKEYNVEVMDTGSKLQYFLFNKKGNYVKVNGILDDADEIKNVALRIASDSQKEDVKIVSNICLEAKVEKIKGTYITTIQRPLTSEEMIKLIIGIKSYKK